MAVINGYGMPRLDMSSLADIGRPPPAPGGVPLSSLGDASRNSWAASVVKNDGTPASIRYNNPGAQYPGPTAKQFGSTDFGIIGGGHKIARFNTPEEGAAAQFGLLSRVYAGMPLSAAITKWSDGNSSPQYVASVARATGLSPDTPITPALLQSPQGVSLAKAMARQEAGRDFPMTDEQWMRAQGLAFRR